MVELKEITDWDNYINQEEKVLVDFHADWCGPCKVMDVVLEELSQERPDLKIVKVDTDRFSGLARKYKVITIPAIKIFQKGEIIQEKNGLLRKEELEEFLESRG